MFKKKNFYLGYEPVLMAYKLKLLGNKYIVKVSTGTNGLDIMGLYGCTL